MSKLTRQTSGVVEGTLDESMRTQSDTPTGSAVDSLMSRRLSIRRRIRALNQRYSEARARAEAGAVQYLPH